jgi:Protein of unknown function (DUF3106)
MKLTFRNFWWVGLMWGCVVYLSALDAKAQATNSPGSTANETRRDLAAGKSPVAVFRELLNMEPAERTKALANRSEETRKRILAKIREYQSLKPDERKLRLKVTELGYYLRPLMQTPGTNRAAQLGGIPEGYRELVQVRLEKWDGLSPETQKRLLLNDAAIRAMTELTNAVSTNVTRLRWVMLKHTINNWNQLPPRVREELTNKFDDFFQLKPTEIQRAAKILSPEERAQISATLQKFGNLTANQRAQCIQSFGKLAAMSDSQRQLFFQNAERWEMMTPRERDEWRKLVETAPSLPPVSAYPALPRVTEVSGKLHAITNAR